jgi:hypothetical protein
MKTKLIYRRANVQRTADIRFVLDVEASEGLTPIRVTLQNGTAVTKHVLSWADGEIRQAPPRDLYVTAKAALGVDTVERTGDLEAVGDVAATVLSVPADAGGFTEADLAKLRQLRELGII